jgi:squalene-hopene/tetraprenyl-beta-curcumene cyclase
MKNSSRSSFVLAAIAVGSLFAFPAVRGAEADASKFDAKKYEATVEKGIDYLAHAQGEDGSFGGRRSLVGVTAIVATAMLENGRTADDPVVAKALKHMEKYVQKDGGIYTEAPGMDFHNYETSIAIMCLAAANKDKRYDKLIRNAEKFLKDVQWTESSETKKEDPNYGGAGYGKSRRPDLSNTAFFIDALKAAGNGPDDEAMKKAAEFVSKCQNLESEHNTLPFATKNPDGGFIYTPADGGQSPAGKLPDGGLRSYASMTYAGLKSLLYAGVSSDDPRVKAAVKWASMHYDLSSNPGMGTQGLYYYYHLFAKANAVMKVNEITDAKGVKHDWRTELVDVLAKKQEPNGSWVNDTDRFMEKDPNLVTSFALMALAYCKPEAPR